jgi:hypothetical protein
MFCQSFQIFESSCEPLERAVIPRHNILPQKGFHLLNETVSKGFIPAVLGHDVKKLIHKIIFILIKKVLMIGCRQYLRVRKPAG